MKTVRGPRTIDGEKMACRVREERPSFGHEHLRVALAQVEHVAHSRRRKVDAVDDGGELARQPNLHTPP
jgi:hypothetical protein